MSAREKKTILLVEDEVIIAMTTKALLEDNGYEAIEAHNGEDAIRLAEENPSIDLVLMDIDLGRGIDGTEAARLTLESREIPIVFLTSHSEREMVDRVKHITRYGYVIKNSGDFVLLS
ncbi:MAG TPA: response regulator, partial [Spirochaetota bacterium]|nr:response regulator [Spirochaetota bacterium]